MNIDNYKILITNLPLRKQCFTTKRTTWKKAENEVAWLKTLNDKLFGDSSTLTISRQDIFDTKELREAIIKTIYWGYMRGMRGNHFVNILNNIDIIEKQLLKLRETENPTTSDFNNMILNFKNVSGLGLSTYSKLLYFLNISFEKNPCLILDQRLINVFKSKAYSNFIQLNKIRYVNAEKKYLDFLKLMHEAAINIETEGENIELFLFIFGNNLKEI